MTRRRAFLLMFLLAVIAAWWMRSWPAIYLGKRQLQAANAEAGLEWLQLAVRWQPSQAEAHYQLARAYRLLGRTDEMQAALEAARSHGLPESEAIRQLALWNAAGGRLREAESHLKPLLLDQRDERAEICEAYVRGFLEAKRFLDAVPLLEGWLQDEGPQAKIFTLRGHVQREAGRLGSAERDYKKALDLDPDLAEAHLSLGELFLQSRRPAMALSHLRAAGDDARLADEARFSQAVALRLLGRHTEAAEVLAAIPQENPLLARRRLLEEARLAQLTGDSQRAISLLRRGLDQRSNDYRFQDELGRLLMSRGEKVEAAGLLREAEQRKQQLITALSRLSTSEDPAERIDRRLEVAQAYAQAGLQREAIAWAKSVLHVRPEHQQAKQLLRELESR